MVGFLLNVWWLLVLIGVMILIHELGHFWAARAFDVKVEVFSFGFGPRLFGFRRGETDYRFSLVLFGGYVKMAGEQQPGDRASEQAALEQPDDPRYLNRKPRWQRLIITAAGPFMNVVLAIAVLTGLYMVSYEKIVDENGAVIGHVMADSPAAKAGIQAGDKIVRLNGRDNPTWEDIVTKEIAGAGLPMTVTLERSGHRFVASVTPVLDEKEGVGSAGWEGQNQIEVGGVTDGMPAAGAGLQKGDLLLRVNNIAIHSMYTLPEVIRHSDGKPVTIVYSRNGEVRTATMKPDFKTRSPGDSRWMIGVASEVKWNVQKMKLSFPAALEQSLIQNGKNASLIVEFLRGMVERRMSAKNLEGPIGIAHQATEAAAAGPGAFLSLMSVVSLNLAIVNLLPIPILDGAMILTLLIEMVMGRDISVSVKETALKLGFLFLMMLMVFVIYNDIARRFTPGLITLFFR
jgi:regulator of sigma E protease